jgi:hypothetical protein
LQKDVHSVRLVRIASAGARGSSSDGTDTM